MKTTSVELNEMLKVNETQNQMRNLGGINSGDAFFLNGYSLDDEGIVDLPLVGEIKLVGMTAKEAKLAVEEKLKKYVTQENYYVQVRLGGIRYSALGEFFRPGKYTVLQNRVTIYEAIANAGDMTTAANRTEILLVRQYPDGTRTHTINLLSDKIMESEFFFIRPNDMIYAQPLKVKQLGTGLTFAQSLQLALSLITVTVLIITANK
jgi:polysaccharide export outer membrane protein